MKLSNNCYAVLGLGYSLPWMVNSGFVIGEEKTLVIDSGPNYIAAQTIFGYAKNIKPGNELIVVNTEKHFDHILGNSFFKENGAAVYGHRDVFRSEYEFEEEKKYFNENVENKKRRDSHEENIFFQNTKIANPDFHLDDNQVFDLGGIDAKIIFTPGHTNSNVSVYIQKQKTLYCGDLIVNGYLPNLEAGSIEDWKLWLNSLELISKLDVEFIVPGHGCVIVSSGINKKIAEIRNTIEDAIIEGKAPTV